MVKIVLVKLETAGIRVNAFMKYVDDINLIIQKLEMGTRWMNGRLETRDSWREEDMKSGKSQERITMDVIRTMADDVFPWLRFTSDLPEDHGGKMVPMLDLQVWVVPASETGERFDYLCWKFFEKRVNTMRVLHAKSALTWRCKLVSLNQECFRRLRNTARQVPAQVRVEILNKFVQKLRSSGYNSRTTEGIIVSGVRCYYRKVGIELTGGPRINERNDQQDLPRRRRKMGESLNWFKRRKGGKVETTRKENRWRNGQGKSGSRGEGSSNHRDNPPKPSYNHNLHPTSRSSLPTKTQER